MEQNIIKAYRMVDNINLENKEKAHMYVVFLTKQIGKLSKLYTINERVYKIHLNLLNFYELKLEKMKLGLI